MAWELTKGSYVRYPHIEYVSRRLAQKLSRGNARIIVSLPPRHGKSWLISRWTPTWYLALNPDHNVILTSYEADFAATWGRSVRNTIQEHTIRLGVKLSQDSQAVDRWNTTKGGGMITAGVGGAITGRGGNLIIVDDPVKNWEQASSEVFRQRTIDWWGSTLRTRAEPGASIVVLATRWHERDLSGYLMSEENEIRNEWEEIRLPAIAEDADPLGRTPGQALCPERYDVASLDEIKRSVGSRAWAALYQQSPAAAEGNLIKREWLRFYDNLPERFEEQIISVDATFTGKSTSDFVAMQVWGRFGARKYLLDQVHKQMGITDTISALISLCQKWKDANLKLIENKANGPAIEDLLSQKLSGIVLWEPQGDKTARVNVCAPQFEAGNVFFPLPARNPWVESFVDELVTFPNAAHDDRTDACTMALIRLDESVTRNVGTIRVLR